MAASKKKRAASGKKRPSAGKKRAASAKKRAAPARKRAARGAGLPNDDEWRTLIETALRNPAPGATPKAALKKAK